MKVVGETRIDERTLDIAIQSPSIDAPAKRVRLLLPRDWSADAERTWPTLYLLHGGLGDHRSWTDNSDIERLSADRDVMAVMPETSWCSAYSDWWNHGEGGSPRWETYLTWDMRKVLEGDYRAGTQRAVAGLSMGGLGALKLAANHPGLFSAAASFSGNVDPLHSYSDSADGVDTPGIGCGADWRRVWGDPTIPAEREIWRRNNPYDQAAHLAGVTLYISSGDGQGADAIEQQIDRESKELVEKLTSLGIPATAHFYSGTHCWTFWRRELRLAFPLLMTAIGA